MKIQIQTKTLSDALEDVYLKGKYHNGDSAKNGSLSGYAMLEVLNDTQLALYNGDATTVCRVVIDVTEPNESDSNIAVIEIEKMLKYLKTFDDSVTIDIGDYIKLSDGTSNVSIPIVTHHPHSAMIARIQGYDIDVDDPKFGSVDFETVILVNPDILKDAVKRCDTINNARYRFDYDGDNLTLSSFKSEIDKIETRVIAGVEGEPSTVEVTGHFHKFFRGTTGIYLFLKDESPLVWKTDDRVLIKAPYITR